MANMYADPTPTSVRVDYWDFSVSYVQKLNTLKIVRPGVYQLWVYINTPTKSKEKYE